MAQLVPNLKLPKSAISGGVTMIIRSAEPKDDAVLLGIESVAGQGDQIRLIGERDSFFSRARQFENTLLFVGENETTGKLHGVVAASVLPVRVGGRERIGAYMFDLRSNPETNKGLSRAMYLIWKGLEDRLLQCGTEFIYGLIKEDNSRSYSIATRMGATPRGEKRFLTFPVFRRIRVSREVQTISHVDAMEEHLAAAKHYDGPYQLWPIMDDFSYMQGLLDKYLVTKMECGSSSLKIWDSSLNCAYRVSAMPRPFEILGTVLRAASHLVPLPKIPMLSQKLRIWNVYDIITRPGQRSEAQALIAKANNLALEHGVDFLIITVDAEEEELRWLRRRCLMPLDYKLMVKEYNPVPEFFGKTYFDPRYLG